MMAWTPRVVEKDETAETIAARPDSALEAIREKLRACKIDGTAIKNEGFFTSYGMAIDHNNQKDLNQLIRYAYFSGAEEAVQQVQANLDASGAPYTYAQRNHICDEALGKANRKINTTRQLRNYPPTDVGSHMQQELRAELQGSLPEITGQGHAR